MRSTMTKSLVANLVKGFKRTGAAIVGFMQRQAEERRRRRALEEEFYTKLKKQYSAQKMPIMWEDDWRMQR
jgi:hypothetical protein